MEELSADDGGERRGGRAGAYPGGCSSRPGNREWDQKGRTGVTPQVNSSPLFRGLLMSKVIRLDKGSRHLKVRAFWGS